MRRLVLAAAAVTALAACGSDPHEYVGVTPRPAAEVGDVSLPELTAGGGEFAMRGPDDGLLFVYFGYTNCPLECPTTLGDIGAIERALSLDDPGIADRIDVAMVTIDPARDLPVLADYVAGFVPDAHALGTADDGALEQAATKFGVTYQVSGGQVAHTTHLFAVDDTGTNVMIWTFPTDRNALQADIEALLS